MSTLYESQSQSQSGDYCKVWPEPTTIPGEEPPTGVTVFSIVVKQSYIYSPLYLSMDDRVHDWGDLVFMSREDQTLEIERDLLMNHDTLFSKSILEDKLFALDVPSWPSMIEDILKCARDMACNKELESYKVLRMCARIDIVVDEPDELFPEPDEEEEEVLFPEASDMEPVRVPASESAMEKLEIIKIEDESTGSCRVCLEEILLGSQATRLPCAHLFHGECILSWLNQSKFCPLCRFELD